MEAMWARFTPAADVIRQLLENGALGELQYFRADLGEYFAPEPGARLFDPELGGGSLLDLGVYLLAYDAFVFGGAPDQIDVSGNRAVTGVSADVALTLRHGAAISQLFTTLDARTPTEAFLKGANAVLEISAPFYAPSALTLRANDASSAVTERYAVRTQADGLCYEAAEAARCVAEGRTESRLHPLEDTIGTLRMLDRAEAMLD
ncbi:putative oxidoreductase [Gulosibacter sp. 10]|nr:putative oxidoreductase [Gulosibacter sp. 10]